MTKKSADIAKYEQHVSGERRKIKYKEELFVTACCDCGLVHSMDFGVRQGVLTIKIDVMHEQTQQTRKEIKFVKK